MLSSIPAAPCGFLPALAPTLSGAGGLPAGPRPAHAQPRRPPRDPAVPPAAEGPRAEGPRTEPRDERGRKMAGGAATRQAGYGALGGGGETPALAGPPPPPPPSRGAPPPESPRFSLGRRRVRGAADAGRGRRAQPPLCLSPQPRGASGRGRRRRPPLPPPPRCPAPSLRRAAGCAGRERGRKVLLEGEV